MLDAAYSDNHGVLHLKLTHTDRLSLCDHHHPTVLWLQPRPIYDAPVTCIWCIYESAKEP